MNGNQALAALMGRTETGPEVESSSVNSITILPGTDKQGNTEDFDSITFNSGEVVCIVGPTGSGKSRLLADIEWLARGDTPTGRRILVDGVEPDLEARYTGTGRLVAQLSQNMNFVMDICVEDFLRLHAQSRGVEAKDAPVQQIIDSANELTGEPLSGAAQLTELSGGQSRALMIADTALLSTSPIVLIDEIENAGIDRLQAIELLRGVEKIVLAATHDPSLALLAERRLVIANGGIAAVRDRTDSEAVLAERLRARDRLHQSLREALRGGGTLDGFLDQVEPAATE